MFNNQQIQNRLYPYTVDSTFTALREVVEEKFKLKSVDDITKALTFSSGLSAFTWGENFTASVEKTDNGASVNISGVGKIGGQMMQSRRTNKLLDQVFLMVSAKLKQVGIPMEETNPSLAPGQSIPEQLAQLSKLRDSGALSDEDFNAAKKRILDS